MTYVIGDPCIDVKDRACVDECPVDCIYEGGRSLYIHPDECVDCGACEPVCPVEAIYYEDDLPADLAPYKDDNARFFTQPLPGGGTATVVWSKQENGAVLITQDMAEAPSGHEYALWLQQDDTLVPAGIMPSGGDNTVLLEGDAATADGAGISVEVAGENPEQPSEDVVALIAFDA